MDAHVHFHPCFGDDEFLSAADSAFRVAGRELGVDRATGVLMFAETSGSHEFRRLQGSAGGLVGEWRLRATEEGFSLVAERGRDLLLLAAGRQLRTVERLEVLALGVDRDLPEGQRLRDTLDAVREADGLAVIPWGFGKWRFGRGRLLSRTMRTADTDGLFVGDNGTRPAGLGRPRIFEFAEALAIPNLPGSDPFPFPDHVRRVGTCGTLLSLHGLDAAWPISDLKRHLCFGSVKMQPYGSRRAFGAFCFDQARLGLKRIAGVLGG